MFSNMKTYFTPLFLALLLLSLGMKSSEAQNEMCTYGTVEMDKCSISECISDCRDKVTHSTGRCITIDTCCCVNRDDVHR
ncbi:hypothetical protein RND81_09G014800 [Saponaria officinalis]|uniref:Uncharacterized protein n=1 Tax=Saponaria officinalis TaxID=3572 RepID=A0AAW1IGL2_SAPOF